MADGVSWSQENPSHPHARMKTLTQAMGGIVRIPSARAGLVALLIFAFFAVVARGFLSVEAAKSYLTMASENGVLALGVTLLMIGGEFDLSVGSVLGLSALLVPLLVLRGIPPAFAILIGLGVGAVIGSIHGALVTVTHAPSLIVTLGGLMFWRGAVFALTGGFLVPVDTQAPVFRIFSASWEGFQVSLLWLAALVLLLSVTLARTRFGNWVFATGGNSATAVQSGIPVKRVKIILFMLTAMLAALAGMIQMTRFASVEPLRGQGAELRAITAAVIGGTRLEGGRGTVLGTAFGVLTIAMIKVGLQLARVPGYFLDAAVGAVLVLAVLVNVYTGRAVRASA
jgi:simple sugar transport system permease protein